MAQDLKIELRKILALHKASLYMEHAIREAAQPDDPWQVFPPSRFIYAFFTFNSIYSWDWQTSFETNHLESWRAKEKGHYPKELDQIKGYVRFCYETLCEDVVELFSMRFTKACRIMGVSKPADAMQGLDITNADKKLKRLKDQMPKLVKLLYEGSVKPDDFHFSACHVLHFVYGVRCNLFHGRKTRVQMLDAKQQKRLLIYASLLTAANGLLFDATKRKGVGFGAVKFDFLKEMSRTNGAMTLS